MTALKSAKLLTAIFMILLLAASLYAENVKLSPEKAGDIGKPEGRIAFLRESNVWVMNCDGFKQRLVTEVTNAEGRLSFSADDRQIAFPRIGKVEASSPTLGEGGFHKVYDLFTAFLDSADNNSTKWWLRLTDDFGSRAPEISADGSKLVYLKDLNGHEAFPLGPNYQVCTMAPDGSEYQVIRKDWANPGDEFMRTPSMSADGKLAFVYYKAMKPVGIAVLGPDEYMMSMAKIEILARRQFNMLAPAWSPDGQWLACISNNVDDQGLFIYSSDLKQKLIVTGPPIGSYISASAPGWSPNSKWLTYATTDGSVWIIDITGNGNRRISGPGLDKSPAWSKTSAQD